ncbi:transposable element Tcb1 transposase [Trichonephila clavipes]|nr:transposable element Tcb1 transposase [Trichonephila clavipes]
MEYLALWKIPGMTRILPAAADIRTMRSSTEGTCILCLKLGLVIWQVNGFGYHNLSTAAQSLRCGVDGLNHQRARIVRHNNESVREGYVRKSGKEVKLFTSALKAFQCNNRIVMAQRKHLDDFLRGRIIGRLECGRTQLEVSEELGIAQSVISSLWQGFQEDAPGTRYHQENTIERHHYGGAGWLVWDGIILDCRTGLHVQSLMMTCHIYRVVILEQHVRLFRCAMDAEFLFIDDNTRPHLCKHCRRIPSIEGYHPYGLASILTGLDSNRVCVRYNWPTNCSPSTTPPTGLPQLRRALLDEWCSIPQDPIDNLILRMPRRCSSCIASSGRNTPH